VYLKCPDIITETWLTGNIFDNDIPPSNYTLFCRDRPSRGGGVLIVVNNKIPCQEIISLENFEIVCIKLRLPNPITICVSYAPLSSTAAYYNDLFNFLLNLHGIDYCW